MNLALMPYKVFNEIIENYQVSEKIGRLSQLELGTPLTMKLSEIINGEGNAGLKKYSIEKIVREHDKIGVVEDMKNSVNVKSVILHDIYKIIDKELSTLLQVYKINKYNKLKTTLESNNYDELYILATPRKIHVEVS